MAPSRSVPSTSCTSSGGFFFPRTQGPAGPRRKFDTITSTGSLPTDEWQQQQGK